VWKYLNVTTNLRKLQSFILMKKVWIIFSEMTLAQFSKLNFSDLDAYIVPGYRIFSKIEVKDRIFKVDIFWKIWDRIIPSSGPYIFRWWLYILSRLTLILSRPYFSKDRILTILDRIFYSITAMATIFLDFRIL